MTVLSLASILAESARRTPEHTAVIERTATGDVAVTYADLWRDARRYAAGLAAQGLGPGSRVALLAPNVTDFVRAYYGVLALGGTVVPVPTLLNADEATFLVQHSGARAVLHHASFAEVGGPAAQAAGVPAWDLAGFADGLEPVPSHASRDAEDPAVIFYTSGTTGRPKGAVLTHLNLVHERDRQRLRRQPVPARRRRDGLPAAVPHLRPVGLDELDVPGGRHPAAAAALRGDRRDRADDRPPRHAVLRGADHVRAAARGGPPGWAGARAAARCATASPAAPRCRWPCSRSSRRCSAPGSSRATGCRRPRRPRA